LKTAIITSDTSLNHLTGIGHPEQPDRVTSVINKLKQNKNLIWKKPSNVDSKYLELTHTKNYVLDVKNSFPQKGLKFLDGDTVVSPGSSQATIDAVGSIISAVDGIENNKYKNAFCAVRPPGHHAEKQKSMGFCIYNNVAVGANYLIKKYNYKKIAIIDFDVHHGNGTQDIFFESQKVLYISTHQYPFYPGSGTSSEKGKYNNILNIPLSAGTNSREYLDAYNHVIKKLEEFKPDFLMFSAGFDGHKDDPLAQFELNSKDFHEITRRTLLSTNKFTKGKVISILEGGYDLKALAESADYHVNALLES
tara:strand:+ start:719 stop:1639 length:921 start_codon:yes stop_codon:yes gene_type:complete